MHHLERHATEWIEIRAGNLRVRKGFVTSTRLRAISDLLDGHELPSQTAVWITRSRSVHFKPNFPPHLRAALRDLML